jgi:aldehyde dehydrogenase (NAD+)
MNVKKIIKAQRAFFESGITLDLEFRINTLRRLYRAIQRYEHEITDALHKDFMKPPFEGYITEVGVILDEIRHTRKHLRKWAKPKKVKTPLIHFPSKSYVHPEPYGTTLIIAPWNYPFQLMMSPLIGALAAGNTAVLKPATDTKHTAEVIRKIIDETFTKDYVVVFDGTRKQGRKLVEEDFDYIFFTGSTAAGKVVAQAAGSHLTPCTLELGGKSPAIVAASADLDITARRIVWGKFVNAGQTCIAPDYLMVEESVREELLGKMKAMIRAFYGEDPRTSESYSRIINTSQYDRIVRLLESGEIYTGGRKNRKDRYIEPTILTNVKYSDPIMKEEIFGPVLPVLSIKKLDDAVKVINNGNRPLAAYIFSSDKKEQEKIIREVRYGGGCINDVLMHVANPHLPFGGVRASGQGRYHGEYSFKTFSNMKSVLRKGYKFDMVLRYPPYSQGALSLIKRMMK